MRVFVALSISAEVREKLAALLVELNRADPKVRWIEPANLHLTLKFIGQVADEKLPSVKDVLQSALASSPISFEIRGLGFFPNQRRPAVVWAGVQAPPELAALADCVDRSLEGCDVPRETRPFAPHLTLARFKDSRLSAPLRARIEQSREESFGSQVSHEFDLMESKTKSAGAEYTTLHSFPFVQQEHRQ